MARLSPAVDSFERRKSVIGIRMTLLYSLIYAGFVVLSVFRPGWMGGPGVFGLNLAVAYGLGLILIAILFALVYNQLCRPPANGNGNRNGASIGKAGSAGQTGSAGQADQAGRTDRTDQAGRADSAGRAGMKGKGE